jgi:hypothetical protein
MPISLSDLQARRAQLLNQPGSLGDLRSGSISNTTGRCGKSNCRCHRPGQAPHGPNPRLTYKMQGRTVTESLAGSAAQKKAEREIAEFRRFEQLIREFIEVNALICRTRPAEDTLAPQEKNGRGDPYGNRTRSNHAVGPYLRRAEADRRHGSGSGGDGLPRLSASGRAAALTQLLQFPEPTAQQRNLPCPCGQHAHYGELRSRRLVTALGEVELSRPWYLCPHCHSGQFVI